MQMKSDGAEIDRAENVELYGEWIKFTDGEGASVKIAIDVVLELGEFIHPRPRTPWFPQDVDPVRPGVYMVDQAWRPHQEIEAVYAYWDGTNWYPQGTTPSDAIYTMFYGPKKNGQKFRQWRGLKGEE
jgi:hypothetical protein